MDAAPSIRFDHFAYPVDDLVKAEDLSLPIRGEQITILGGGDSLNISVGYDVNIEIPLIQRQIYTKRFEHFVKYKPPI